MPGGSPDSPAYSKPSGPICEIVIGTKPPPPPIPSQGASRLVQALSRMLKPFCPSCETAIGTEPPPHTLGDRWWPQTAKKDGDKISKQFLCSIWKERNERPNVGGISIRSKNGAPSRKGCVVNGQMAKAINKLVRPSPPPPGASRLVQAMSVWSSCKPDVGRSGIVAIRGSMVLGLRPLA